MVYSKVSILRHGTFSNPEVESRWRLTRRTDTSVDGGHCGNNDNTRLELSFVRCISGDPYCVGHERRQARGASIDTDYCVGRNDDHNGVVD